VVGQGILDSELKSRVLLKSQFEVQVNRDDWKRNCTNSQSRHL